MFNAQRQVWLLKSGTVKFHLLCVIYKYMQKSCMNFNYDNVLYVFGWNLALILCWMHEQVIHGFHVLI